MKTETQTSEDSKSRSPAKSRIFKAVKSAVKKSASKSPLSPRSRKASANSTKQMDFMVKGKDMLTQLPQSASDTAGAVLRQVRNLELPDSTGLQNFLREKPLIVGALGLGLGVVAGALLPSFRDETKSKSKK